MKYLFVIAIFAVLFLSFVSLAIAEQGRCGNGICETNEIAEGCDPPETGANPCANLVYCPADCADEVTRESICGNGICEDNENLRTICPTSNCEGDDCPKCQKACEQDCGNSDETSSNSISANSNSEKRKVRIDEEEIETELEIEEGKENNQSKLKVNLSNGRKAEIKIMPETASSKAIETLGNLNFTIQLKEVGKNETDTRLVYELQAERHYRILGLFKAKAQVKAEVDAETGELLVVKKPWWAFLATNSD